MNYSNNIPAWGRKSGAKKNPPSYEFHPITYSIANTICPGGFQKDAYVGPVFNRPSSEEEIGDISGTLENGFKINKITEISHYHNRWLTVGGSGVGQGPPDFNHIPNNTWELIDKLNCNGIIFDMEGFLRTDSGGGVELPYNEITKWIKKAISDGTLTKKSSSDCVSYTYKNKAFDVIYCCGGDKNSISQTIKWDEGKEYFTYYAPMFYSTIQTYEQGLESLINDWGPRVGWWTLDQKNQTQWMEYLGYNVHYNPGPQVPSDKILLTYQSPGLQMASQDVKEKWLKFFCNIMKGDEYPLKGILDKSSTVPNPLQDKSFAGLLGWSNGRDSTTTGAIAGSTVDKETTAFEDDNANLMVIKDCL